MYWGYDTRKNRKTRCTPAAAYNRSIQFFFVFFSRRFVVCRFCTSKRSFGYSAIEKPFFISYPKINPLRRIYFRRENKSKSRYDLFLNFFFNQKKTYRSVANRSLQLNPDTIFFLFLFLVVDKPIGAAPGCDYHLLKICVVAKRMVRTTINLVGTLHVCTS